MKKSSLLFATILMSNLVFWGFNSNAQICFSSATTLAAGTTPFAVTSADFNGDNKKDMATGNGGSNDVSILIGDGLGGFSAPTNISNVGGSNPNSIVSADFNGDTKMDLATANRNSNNVSVFIGNGAGSFSAPAIFSTGTDPRYIASADFNGDSKMDLVTANRTANNVSVLLGDGAGNFSAPVNFSTGNMPEAVFVADFNGDSKMDIVTANNGPNNVSVLLGDGAGSFSAPTNFAAGTQPTSVISADFNGDSKMDLAVANNGSNNISVLLGNGLGSFSAATNYVAFGAFVSVVNADVNGDSKMDLIALDYNGSPNLKILVGDGTGAFTLFPLVFSTGNYSRSLITADFNGDSKMDLAASNGGGNTVSVLLNLPVPTVTASASPATSICPGTSLTLTGGGTATSYVWSGGVTDGVGFVPTSSTSYVVTGTGGNGCKNTTAIAITVYTPPTVTANAGPAATICPGTSLTLTGGGTASAYAWSGGVTNGIGFVPTSAATYTVTGTDVHSCTNTNTISIAFNPLPVQPAPFTASTATVCAGQSGVAYIVTNDPSVSYLWSYSGTGATINGSTNSVTVNFSSTATSGTLSVTALNSCDTSAAQAIAVTVNAAPNANIGPDSLWVCDGDMLTFSLSSTTGISTYSILTSFQTANNNPLSFTYNSSSPPALVQSNVIGTNGCAATDVIHLIDNTIGNFFQGLATANDPAYTFNAGVMPAMVDSWSWDLGDGATQTGGMAAPHTYTANGTYTVCLIGMDECDTASDCITVTVNNAAGIGEYLLGQSISIYPNPSAGIFFVKSEIGISGIEIENIIGEKIYSASVKTKNTTINLSQKPKGIYFIRVNTDKGIATKKLIIQ
jgi:ankyrin repeat protein